QHKVAAIVLAAGRSTRMGAANKLLAELGGTAVVRRVAEAALASQARPVLVVTGHQAEAVRSALAGLDVTFVANPDFAQGLSTSLKAGLRALSGEADGALILLGDMPRIAAGDLDRLIALFAAEGGEAIIAPLHEGKRGNPVVWPRAYFAEMLELEGDAGAGRLLAAHADRVRGIDLGTDAIHADVDTPEALAELRSLSPLAGRGSG
ncbi:MAG TPA: nucleotidyltransferase family protein, partial [Hyphomicrobiaceae bacterium]